MQYPLGFVYNPSPNVKKRSPLYLSSLYTIVFSFIGTGGRQQDIDCVLSSGVLCEKEKHHLSAAHPHEGLHWTRPVSPGWAFLSAQKPSPWLSLDLSTDWQQSLIQQCNLNPNTAKSNIHCETCFSGELEKLLFLWKALNYDLCGVFVRFEGRGKWGAKPEEKHVNP